MDIIFDLGGVVVTWRPEEIVSRSFESATERELVLKNTLRHSDWLEFDRGALDASALARRASERTGVSGARIGEFVGNVHLSLVPIRESLDLLGVLRGAGHRLLALSNIGWTALAHLEDEYDLFAHFDGRVASCEVGVCKPDAAIYRHLLEKFGVEAGKAVFIDDTEVNTIAAVRLGIESILFTTADACRRRLEKVGVELAD